MLVEIVAFIGAAGIAVILFVIIVLLSERPLKALITALISAYLLLYIYLFILNKLVKRKEEKRTTDL
jgi:VIT1/CCC1 family predicted Fe2+/Mn2+ transporter